MAIAHVTTGIDTWSADRSNTVVDNTVDVGTGSDRTIICIVAQITTSSTEGVVDGVTYNSVSLTDRGNTNIAMGSRNGRISIWTLDNPSSGSNTLSVDYGTVAQAADWIAWVVVTGANNGFGGTSATNGTSDNSDSSITSTATDSLIIIGAAWQGGDLDPHSPNNSEVERQDTATGTNSNDDITAWVAELTGTNGSQTIGATSGGSDDWVQVAVEIMAAGGAPPAIASLRLLRGVGR